MVRPGDTLGVRFSFSDKETFELVKIVKEMGTITLLSNEVFTVTNKFPEQIETEIHDRYASKYSEQLSARVLFTSHRWYLIEGAVRSPGRKPYDDPLSLFDAIQAAGGTTSEADRAKISIAYMEGGAPPAVIDLTKRESKDGREFYLQAGAKIIVPRSRYAKSSNKALVSPSLKE